MTQVAGMTLLEHRTAQLVNPRILLTDTAAENALHPLANRFSSSPIQNLFIGRRARLIGTSVCGRSCNPDASLGGTLAL